MVAEEDWITAVTAAPSATALNGLDVNFSRMRSSFPPATLESPSPMACMPYKNSAKPPSMVSTLKISIILLLILFIKFQNFIVASYGSTYSARFLILQ